MAKYGCPNCKKNAEITEIDVAEIEYDGVFNDHGFLIPWKGCEKGTIGDGLDSYEPRYYCHSCNTNFDNPLQLEE